MIDPTLPSQVRDWIDSGRGDDPTDFLDLCRAIAAAQDALEPDLPGLDAVRPTPEGAFKLMTIAHFPPSEAEAVFRTSGTTTGNPGRHLVRSMDLYRASALAGFDRFAMYDPRPARFVSLIPPGSARPASSLSWMASFVLEAFGTRNATFARVGDALDLAAFRASARAAVDAGEPLCVLGTSLDFLTLFEGLEGAPIPLPPGSRAMHTGGPKATGRAITPGALRDGLARLLAIGPDDAVEEYGMTELLSQHYDSPRVVPGPRRFVPVPWMRTRVLDPLSMTDVPEGGRGVLCHYDLANASTAVAVLTQDLATSTAGGFTDVVRAPGGTPRGCSSEAATVVRKVP